MHLTLNKDGVKTPALLGTMVHTVTADEATANAIALTTESLVVEGATVSIRRAGVEVLDAAVVTFATNVLTITDGGTYAATAGDIVNVVYFGGA